MGEVVGEQAVEEGEAVVEVEMEISIAGLVMPVELKERMAKK